MINLIKINEELLKRKNDDEISVSIIDSGFSNIPKYAKLYGENKRMYHPHGNRVLSIFKALDNKYPIENLKLNLVCYNEKDKYEGLINCLNLLPHADILSISLSWKDNHIKLYKLLLNKADKICVPYSTYTSNPYPSSYKEVITCSNIKEGNADYCITPNKDWNGNSYAVPAIARLLCYGNELINDDKNGIEIQKLFNDCVDGTSTIDLTNNKILKCPYCKKELRKKSHVYMQEYPNECPYCGRRIEK